jgi:hypothetical protein
LRRCSGEGASSVLGRDEGFVIVVTVVIGLFLLAVLWAASDVLHALGWL